MMRNALTHLAALKEAFSLGERVLFLDFDGTLAPIVLNPKDAHMSKSMRAVLTRCAERCTVVVVSGRSLIDIQERVANTGVVCAGNHGLEWESNGRRDHMPIPEDIAALFPQIRRELETVASRYPGASVEDKTLSLALHYRQVPESHHAALSKEARAVLSAYKNQVIVRDSAMTVECVPNIKWNKGVFALHFLRTFGNGQAGSMYIGDELTDEDAFQLLPGTSVRVGKSSTSAAQYYLPSQEDVEPFLLALVGE